jgi:hypothetical protein
MSAAARRFGLRWIFVVLFFRWLYSLKHHFNCGHRNGEFAHWKQPCNKNLASIV